jgi:hypothetical protein
VRVIVPRRGAGTPEPTPGLEPGTPSLRGNARVREREGAHAGPSEGTRGKESPAYCPHCGGPLGTRSRSGLVSSSCLRSQPDTSIVCSTTVLLLAEVSTGPREDDAVVSYHPGPPQLLRARFRLALHSHGGGTLNRLVHHERGRYSRTGDPIKIRERWSATSPPCPERGWRRAGWSEGVTLHKPVLMAPA